MPEFNYYITVPEGYVCAYNEGIYSVLKPEFKTRLDAFATQLKTFQEKENYPFLPEHLVTAFPHIDYPPFKNEIRERQQDIELLKIHLPLKTLRQKLALELGGWNGWLPALLAGYNIHTVCVGIFADMHNGLGCRHFHKNPEWLSVQADIEDLSIHKGRYDLIVFEHNLSFQHEPLKLLLHYEKLLNPGGFLVVLGVAIAANPAKKAREVAHFRTNCQNRYGFNIDFYNSQGFFDRHVYNSLLQRGYRFIPYYFSAKDWLIKKISGGKNGIFMYQSTDTGGAV